MQILNRCKHPSTIKRGRGFDFRLARLAVRLKIPGAYHYVISSFFFPPVRKKFTTLVPPILRPEVIAAKREPGEHVLVYLRTLGDEALVSTLKTLPYRFRVYGTAEHGTDGNVTLLPFSGTGFLEDLRTPRAVLAGGGFSLMSDLSNQLLDGEARSLSSGTTASGSVGDGTHRRVLSRCDQHQRVLVRSVLRGAATRVRTNGTSS